MGEQNQWLSHHSNWPQVPLLIKESPVRVREIWLERRGSLSYDFLGDELDMKKQKTQ